MGFKKLPTCSGFSIQLLPLQYSVESCAPRTVKNTINILYKLLLYKKYLAIVLTDIYITEEQDQLPVN